VSTLKRVAGGAGAAALLVATIPNIAAGARAPTTGPNGGEHASSSGPHRACKPAPAKLGYPLWSGSPTCCTEPLTWRARKSAGKTYWDCIMPAPLHL
jgi:hypothetical protein